MSEKDEWQRLVEMNKTTEYWIGRCSRAEKQLEQHEWVSVKDRLPEPNIEVLVYSKKRGVTKDFVDAFSLTGTVTFYRNPDVTHWMPLPQKPESEVDEE